MSEHPARILEKFDPEYIKRLESINEFILADGALLNLSKKALPQFIPPWRSGLSCLATYKVIAK